MPKEKAAPSSSTTKSKATKSAVGAPSQRAQTSRKGKKAWRKHVDLDEVEQGLEEVRSEERLHGSALHKIADDQLFYVDTKPDEEVQKRLKFSTKQLTSSKILAQRSAVPAVYSRANSTNSASKRKAVSQTDKDRLLRQAKKARRGPLNSIIDEKDDKWSRAKASGLSEAVKNSGQYNPWDDVPEPVVHGDDEFGLEGIQSLNKPAPKPPKHRSAHSSSDPRTMIHLPAVPTPHAGMSYNPPVTAHRELLLEAHNVEEKKETQAEKTREVGERMSKAQNIEEVGPSIGRPGMALDDLNDDEEEEELASGEVITKKMAERKTKAQRRKEAKRLEQKRLLAQQAAKKKMLSTLSSLSAKKIRNSSTPSGEEVAERRRKLLAAKLKGGLAGRRLGKFKVPDSRIDVQLGEELSENLRGLKVEGNLFRDRFLNLQQRALIEPRVPVLPKKRRSKVVEFEKHAWKRFDRVQ